MGEQKFIYQLFQILNHTKRLDIVTLTMRPDEEPPALLLELANGEKYHLAIQETEEEL